MRGEDPEKSRFPILLVGEGNFSFSASLCDISHDVHHITATCYEAEDVVCKHPLSWNNVQHLRSKGAVVHFGVDATKLNESAFLTKQLYDRIIFNFPHCGRKAGIKKNRELLSSFFRSCADVLSPKGEIHVALCQGQGGTPADHPKREWHNSWQVAAMAAVAGFILTSVVPFDSEKHCGYRSTGYRSQEKSFHVVHALTHVFTKGLSLENITPLQIIDQLTVGQDQRHIDSRVHRGFLGKTSHHPIRVVYNELVRFCEQKLHVDVIEDTFSFFCSKDTCLSRRPHSATLANLFFVRPSEEEKALERSKDIHKKQSCPLEQDKRQDTYFANIHTDQSAVQYHLRQSLTCFTEDFALRSNLRPNVLTIVSGLVFRKCLISLRTMPVYHEVLLLLDYCDTPIQLQLLMDIIKNAIDTMAASLISVTTETANNEKTENNFSKSNVTFYKKNEDSYTITMSPNNCDEIIGTINMVAPRDQNKDRGFLQGALNLDLITMSLLGIEDWRLLWTEDERFAEQFHHCNLKPFQNFSLYPPHYIHDISFWVDSGAVFDEVEFHTIALRLSYGNIVDIQLLDRYENVESGNIGLCYRLKYQSCDQALSYKSALEIQLLLREELPRCLPVILR